MKIVGNVVLGIVLAPALALVALDQLTGLDRTSPWATRQLRRIGRLLRYTGREDSNHLVRSAAVE